MKELTRDEDDDDDVFNVDIDFRLCEKRKLRDGDYQIHIQKLLFRANMEENCC